MKATPPRNINFRTAAKLGAFLQNETNLSALADLNSNLWLELGGSFGEREHLRLVCGTESGLHAHQLLPGRLKQLQSNLWDSGLNFGVGVLEKGVRSGLQVRVWALREDCIVVCLLGSPPSCLN